MYSKKGMEEIAKFLKKEIYYKKMIEKDLFT